MVAGVVAAGQVAEVLGPALGLAQVPLGLHLVVQMAAHKVAVWVGQAALARPLLAQSKGAIVFIGSVMSYFGGPVQPAYSASKGAVKNLVMSLGAAYAADGIRVNGVAPGWVLTELSRGARENPERNAQIMSRIPMGRWAETAEIADPILFLCSDAARYMTGTLVPVDGGYLSVG